MASIKAYAESYPNSATARAVKEVMTLTNKSPEEKVSIIRRYTLEAAKQALLDFGTSSDSEVTQNLNKNGF